MKPILLALTIAAGLLAPAVSQAGICHVTRGMYSAEVYVLCSPDITESEAEDFADDANVMNVKCGCGRLQNMSPKERS
jgi:hypothetical protein